MVTDVQPLYGGLLAQGRFEGSPNRPGYTFHAHDGRRSFALDEPSVFKNLLLLGGPGSGKTNAMNLIVGQTRDWQQHRPGSDPGVSLIFDTKGDYLSHPGFCRPGDIIIANDLKHRSRSAVWNLFGDILADGPEPFSYESNARELAASYFRGRGSQIQPFFSNAARDIFASALIYFIRRSHDNPRGWKDNLNNWFLLQFLMRNSATQILKYFSIYHDMRGLSSYIGDGSSNQALGVMAELRSMLYECFQGVFAQKASSPAQEFSIRSAIHNKRNQAIFVLYDLQVGETLAPNYRMLIDLALKEALGSHANGRVHLFLDEMKLLPRLQHLEDALNIGRSKQVSVVAGLQSISQVRSAYDEDIAQNILAGFGSVFTFHLNDAESRQYISELYGRNQIAFRYQNASGAPVDQERHGYTVEDWDLMALKPGHAVIGLASQQMPFPFHFQQDPALP